MTCGRKGASLACACIETLLRGLLNYQAARRRNDIFFISLRGVPPCIGLAVFDYGISHRLPWEPAPRCVTSSRGDRITGCGVVRQRVYLGPCELTVRLTVSSWPVPLTPGFFGTSPYAIQSGLIVVNEATMVNCVCLPMIPTSSKVVDHMSRRDLSRIINHEC